MPALVCSAQRCMYNNAMYCSRGDITVGGEKAKTCQDTCCESFQERRRENVQSSAGSPSARTEIGCGAVNCRYNDGCVCHAEHVDISGAAACECEETECVTFEDKK